MAKYITLDGLSTFLSKLKDGSYKATRAEFGAVKVVSNRPDPITTVGTSNVEGRSYGVELDSNGMAFVNVPWASGLTEIPKASNETLGGIKVVSARSNSVVTVGTTATAERHYGVELDSTGKAFVNVPWTDTKYTLPTASNSAIGGIKIGYSQSDKNYPVQLDSNNKAYVNVPWTGGLTEIPKASNATLGGIKVVGSRSNSVTTVGTSSVDGRYYGIELDSNGKAFVNVPWTDTKVTQTKTTTNSSYPILLAPSAQSATTTTSSYFNPNVTINPSTRNLEGVYLEGVYIKGTGVEEGSVLTVDQGGTAYWESNNNSQDISNTATPNITLKYNVVHNTTATSPTILLPTNTKAGKSWHSTVVLKNPTNLTIGTSNGWSDSQVQNNLFWQNGDKPVFPSDPSEYPTETYFELLFQTYDQIYLSGSSVVPGKIFVSWSKYTK